MLLNAETGAHCFIPPVTTILQDYAPDKFQE